MKTQIFIHDDRDISVVTDCAEERDFVRTFSEALAEVEAIDERMVAAGFEILAKIRGYKAPDVHERRMLAAGRWPHPSEIAVSEGGSEDASGGDEQEAGEEAAGAEDDVA